MNVFVLFGITGDLARKKVIPALSALEAEAGTAIGDQIAIGVGRKPLPPEEFLSLQKSLYIQGDLEAAKTFIRLKKEIYKAIQSVKETKMGKVKTIRPAGQTDRQTDSTRHTIVVYSSMPPHLHTKIASAFSRYCLDRNLNKKFGVQFRFLPEKPTGTDLRTAMADMEIYEKIFKPEEVLFVDHYLFKEPLISLRELSSQNPMLLRDSVGSDRLKQIEVVLYEDMDVSNRGSFYDAVGALNDVGQNHLIQHLAEILLMRQGVRLSMAKSAKKDTRNNSKKISRSVMSAKAAIINALRIVNEPIFGQYKGYLGTKDVKADSKTETFFRIEMKYDDLKCAVSSGKSLGLKKSGITLHFDGNINEIFINMSGGKKDPYLIMFENVVAQKTEMFAGKNEIIAGWKFVNRVRKIKTKKNIVYQNLHDIL